MAVLPIVTYGDPVLARPTKPVARFDQALKELIDDMVQTMYAAPGVGLAAPQIGRSMRLAVIDTSVGVEPDALLVLVNPEIIESEGVQDGEEGCLSIPGFSEDVRRAERVTVRALDADGNEWTKTGDGLLARAFQHELDHLDGRLYYERLGSLRRSLFVRRLKKKARSGDLA